MDKVGILEIRALTVGSNVEVAPVTLRVISGLIRARVQTKHVGRVIPFIVAKLGTCTRSSRGHFGSACLVDNRFSPSKEDRHSAEVVIARAGQRGSFPFQGVLVRRILGCVFAGCECACVASPPGKGNRTGRVVEKVRVECLPGGGII